MLLTIPYTTVYCPPMTYSFLSIIAVISCRVNQFDILEFGGESPLTMRARLVSNRYCPNPLGIGTAKQLDKLEFTYCNTPQLLHR